MSLRRIHLQADLLPLDLYVLVGNYDQAKAWIDRRFNVEWSHAPATASGAVFKSRQATGFECVIWMPYFRRGNAFDAGKLSHEALHVVWRLLEKLGIFDEETHCYMLQWIVDKATYRINGKP